MQTRDEEPFSAASAAPKWKKQARTTTHPHHTWINEDFEPWGDSVVTAQNVSNLSDMDFSSPCKVIVRSANSPFNTHTQINTQPTVSDQVNTC